MSTNSITLQHVYDRRATKARDYMSRYLDAMREATRLTARAETEEDDRRALDACEHARKIAHVACDHGEPGPLIDQLCRAYEIDPTP